jgi:hypothetical protein
MDMSAESKWRSEIMKVNLRINGKMYPEAFNRVLDVDLNLILYIIKFLKFAPERAARAVFFREYCLYNSAKKTAIKGPDGLKLVFNSDTLDLVKSPENTEIAQNLEYPVPPISYIHNPYGGFRIEFLNKYVKDYLLLPKGQSQSLRDRITWWEITRLNEEWLRKLESATEDTLTKV